MDELSHTLQIVEFRLALSRITERYPPDTVAGRLAADVLAKYPNRYEGVDRENDSEPFPIPEIEGLPLARAAHSVIAGQIAERDKVIGIAADALDVADNIIAVNLGTDTPARWDRAMQKVAKARAALAQHKGTDR